MKKTKKLAALVLAMVMAFSLMAVTAAAYGAEEHEHGETCSEETIQPRGRAMNCPVCGSEMMAIKVYKENGHTYSDFKCPVDGTTVDHVIW